MPRYIDAGPMKLAVEMVLHFQNICNGTTCTKCPFYTADIKECGMGSFLANLPTVDAEPVVRCKDCKHYKEFEGEMECWARPMMFPREPNDFCSMGERREDE